MKTLLEKFESCWTPEANSGCWLWTLFPNGSGRPRFCIGKKIVFAYRAAWELTRGPIPDGLCVCHKCDTPMCVNPEHLFLGTKADNARDMRNKGRGVIPMGEQNGRAKLTAKAVSVIREELASGTTRAALAERFGVTKRTIGHIHRNQIWLTV